MFWNSVQWSSSVYIQFVMLWDQFNLFLKSETNDTDLMALNRLDTVWKI